MLNENIKRFRKAKGISQEEMAVKLNVVRQTVSKWEKGLSVPDADVLVDIASLLEVTVNQLLDIELDGNSELRLSEELARVNEILAEKTRREKLLRRANEKRGIILAFSFAALIVALIVKNEIVSLALISLCLLAAVMVLWRNLALLTSITTDDYKCVGILRIVTIFDCCIFIAGVIVAVLIGLDILNITKNGEKLFAMAIVSCVIIFSGIISPKLPYNRHTGLRLPWTVQDEDTWNVAHRVLGYIALPIALLFVAGTLTISNFDAVVISAIAAWIGIPGIISGMFFYRKMHIK